MELEKRATQRKLRRDTERNELLDPAMPETHIHLDLSLTTWDFIRVVTHHNKQCSHQALRYLPPPGIWKVTSFDKFHSTSSQARRRRRYIPTDVSPSHVTCFGQGNMSRGNGVTVLSLAPKRNHALLHVLCAPDVTHETDTPQGATNPRRIRNARTRSGHNSQVRTESGWPEAARLQQVFAVVPKIVVAACHVAVADCCTSLQIVASETGCLGGCPILAHLPGKGCVIPEPFLPLTGPSGLFLCAAETTIFFF